MSPRDPKVPPVGEEIHLPRPSLIPIGMAVGITLTLVGLTLTPVLVVAGVVLSLVLLRRWIRDTRHDIDELPLDRH
jgi:membrane protein implicated in regulation of membrane protease activity